MSEFEVMIPKRKYQIAKSKHKLCSPQIIAPNGEKLFLHVPDELELRMAWHVMERYTARIAPNPESALQDLDSINNVVAYHLNPQSSYIAFTAVDSSKMPVAIATTQIFPVSGRVKRGAEGLGFIYQMGLDERVSLNKQDETDLSVVTQLYNCLSELLPKISIYNNHAWLGLVTESRKEGPELEAILEAGFDVLVPNEFYTPPAVQQGNVKDKKNLTTGDLVLLTRDMPKEPRLQLASAEAYLKHAYCNGQDLSQSLELVRAYFAKKVIPNFF